MDEHERHQNGNLSRDLDPETLALIASMQAERTEQQRRTFAELMGRATLPAVAELRPGREIEDREQYGRDAGVPTRRGLAA